MQVVVNIPNWLYNAIMECKEPHYSRSLGDAVRDGTPLPKGHGRLIDVDALNRKDVNCANVPMNFIDTAPTIIEADKEYEAEVIIRGNCMICGKELIDGLFFCKECGDKANSRK